MPASVMYSVRSSAMRLVSVVTSTRPPFCATVAAFGEQVVHLALDGADLA